MRTFSFEAWLALLALVACSSAPATVTGAAPTQAPEGELPTRPSEGEDDCKAGDDGCPSDIPSNTGSTTDAAGKPGPLDASASLPDASAHEDAAPPPPPPPPCTLHTYYEDLDGDGYGGASTTACQKPDGHVALGGDCNDTNPLVHPNVTTYYATPYTLANGKVSFDYDCNGNEDNPPGASPLCTPQIRCEDRHIDVGQACVRAVPTPNRQVVSPNPACGEPVQECVPTTAGGAKWSPNGNIRQCR